VAEPVPTTEGCLAQEIVDSRAEGVRTHHST
jgi:hypothetical protein